jgi:hypothetical protein
MADIHQAFDDLAGNAEAQIALHPGRDSTREAALRIHDRPWRHQPDDRGILPGIADRRRVPRAR